MKVDHLGIAVRKIEGTLEKYLHLFGNPEYEMEFSADGTMKIAHIKLENINIELLEPLDENCAIGKFLAGKGEGIHHIALEVDNIEESLALAKDQGIKVLGEPRPGSNNMLISFLHPKDMNGVLTEFCQPAKGENE